MRLLLFTPLLLLLDGVTSAQSSSIFPFFLYDNHDAKDLVGWVVSVYSSGATYAVTCAATVPASECAYNPPATIVAELRASLWQQWEGSDGSVDGSITSTYSWGCSVGGKSSASCHKFWDYGSGGRGTTSDAYVPSDIATIWYPVTITAGMELFGTTATSAYPPSGPTSAATHTGPVNTAASSASTPTSASKQTAPTTTETATILSHASATESVKPTTASSEAGHMLDNIHGGLAIFIAVTTLLLL